MPKKFLLSIPQMKKHKVLSLHRKDRIFGIFLLPYSLHVYSLVRESIFCLLYLRKPLKMTAVCPHPYPIQPEQYKK